MNREVIEQRAARVAARVPANVGFDPVTIITILTTVIPLISQCFGRNDESDPARTSEAVRKQNESAPHRLRTRTARRIRGEAEQPMSKQQAYALAEAVIEDALADDPDELAMVAMACRDDE